MASAAYQRWVNAGRPYRLASPIKELESWARSNGVTVLGTIGNQAHLEANPPLDHTPFSSTPWPVNLPGYVVTAIDLANDRSLGQKIRDMARARQAPWLKYVIYANQTYTHWDDFQKAGWDSDKHVHISIRSDWCDRSIGGFDPFGTGGFNMFCKFGDRGDAVIALQLRLLELDPTALPRNGADGGYGDETANALSRLVSGGTAQVYGPVEELQLERLLQVKRGIKGEKGDDGVQGPPGRTPTEVQITGRVVSWE